VTQAWLDALDYVINESHVVTGEELSAMADRAVRPLGLTWRDRRPERTPAAGGLRTSWTPPGGTGCLHSNGRCPSTPADQVASGRFWVLLRDRGRAGALGESGGRALRTV
jgi:hypothetical protein